MSMQLPRLWILFGLIFICGSCKNEKTSEKITSPIIKPLDSLSKEKIDLDLLQLSPNSKKDLESFEDFQNLKTMIHELHHANPYHIAKNTDSLNILIEYMNENLSQDLKIKPVQSRITVLSTQVGLLQNIVYQQNQEPEKILLANKNLMTAYNSLIIQLNELSLAIPEEIEKELLRDQENLRDSITPPKS